MQCTELTAARKKSLKDPELKVQLQQLQPRVHNLYWKERRLNVSVIDASRWTS